MRVKNSLSIALIACIGLLLQACNSNDENSPPPCIGGPELFSGDKIERLVMDSPIPANVDPLTMRDRTNNKPIRQKLFRLDIRNGVARRPALRTFKRLQRLVRALEVGDLISNTPEQIVENFQKESAEMQAYVRSISGSTGSFNLGSHTCNEFSTTEKFSANNISTLRINKYEFLDNNTLKITQTETHDGDHSSLSRLGLAITPQIEETIYSFQTYVPRSTIVVYKPYMQQMMSTVSPRSIVHPKRDEFINRLVSGMADPAYANQSSFVVSKEGIVEVRRFFPNNVRMR